MRLTSIHYSEFSNLPEEWEIEPFRLDRINLIVGKNSIGKSRTLNIIGAMSTVLSGKTDILYTAGKWEASFITHRKNDKPTYKTNYSISFQNREIASESFRIGQQIKLSRDIDGKGSLFAEKDNRLVQFQVPSTQIVAVARRDALQHPFLEELFQWGKSVKHIKFNDTGQSNVAVLVKNPNEVKTPLRDLDSIVAIFRRGYDEFGEPYKQKILKDFKHIGFECRDIGLMIPPGLEQFSNPAPLCLFVQENDLPCRTPQTSMSAGMFRALAILITINAGILANEFQTILIDDIGEGLDFLRSSQLISILVKRAEKHSFQLIMTTNDRFIMNAVPLKYWTVLHRTGGHVKVFNRHNAKKKFEEFECLGLNNFDFFTGNHFIGDND